MNDKRIALMGIVVEDINKVEEVNLLLSQYRQGIIGRFGIPHKEKNLSIISIVLDAEQNLISTLSGKLGALKGISVKVLYAK